MTGATAAKKTETTKRSDVTTSPSKTVKDSFILYIIYVILITEGVSVFTTNTCDYIQLIHFLLLLLVWRWCRVRWWFIENDILIKSCIIEISIVVSFRWR